MTEMWVWSANSKDMTSVVGLSVEAIDGSIGKIDEATDDVGSSYIVVEYRAVDLR